MVFVDDAIKLQEEDKLGFDKYVKMIRVMMDDAKDKPFSIGINGKWGSGGSGKSSLLNLVKIELEKSKIRDNQQSEVDRKENSNLYKGYIVVEFDAWLYQGYEDARVALLEQLFESLKENSDDNGTKRIHTEFFKVISRLSKNSFVQNIVKAVGEKASAINEVINQGSDYLLLGQYSSLDNDIKNLREAIEKHLEEKGKKLVVLVDDLDRCLPETALSTLEAIRLFLNIKHTAVVLAGDKEVLQQAVKKQFILNHSDVDHRASSYFDKLITMEINMPTLSEDNIADLLNHLLTEYLAGEDNQVKVKEIIEQVQEFFTYSHHFQGNVRNIKLFFNQLVQIEALLKGSSIEIDRAIIIKILLLKKFGHPSFFDRALLVSRYCSKHHDFVIALFMYEEIFISENEKITDADKAFIRLWLKVKPNLKRSDNRGNSEIIKAIPEQAKMVVRIIEFLAQQHPRKLLINPMMDRIETVVDAGQSFLNVDFIDSRKKLGIYENFFALLEIKKALDSAELQKSENINLGQYKNAYLNLMLTLKDETEAWNLGFILYGNNMSYGELGDAVRRLISAMDKYNKSPKEQRQLDFLDKFFHLTNLHETKR